MYSNLPLYPDLAGRRALVTGGSRGLGRAVALALAAQGVGVAVNGRDAAAIAATCELIRGAGGEAVPALADCADPSALADLREQLTADWGNPELLVCFAGGNRTPPGPVESVSAAAWRETLAQNLDSTFHTVQAFLPGLLAERRGAIVTMASAGARVAQGGPMAYGVAKAGVMALTRYLAQDLGPRGVRVNAVSPSAVLTERTRAQISPETEQRMLAAFPLGRLGQPEDIAAATLFLLSSASAWITGITLDVAGGRIMP